MPPVSSILVVVDRNPGAADAVAKAVRLARKLNAHVELFMCDAERAYMLSQAYISTGVDEARRMCAADAHAYLSALKQSAEAPDVAITIDSACESPLYESIVRKVIRERPDLVIKSAAGAKRRKVFGFDTTDWQLMRTCPVTLILTRGRQWRSSPSFAAAIDATGAESAGVASNILRAAQLLQGCTGGHLDVVYAESTEIADEERVRAGDALTELVQQIADVNPEVHTLAGDPEVTLPAFAGRQSYDAILLGALTHRPGYTAQVGTLTSKLVDALECDFILVKPPAYRSPIGETAVIQNGQRSHRTARP